MYTKKLSALVSLIALLTVFSSAANAKSVYSIIDHGYRPPPIYRAPAKIAAYGINADQIDLQKTVTLDQNYYPTGEYRGPVGMVIDSESGYMFVTHESREDYGGLEGIQLINAKTMMDEGVIELPGAPDLAGIVFDNERQKVYTVERGTNKLFVLLWDAPTKTLTLEGGEPKTLVEMIGNYACGLALDEIDDILYVTSISGHAASSHIVHYFDANDPNWTHLGSIEIVVDNNPRYAVGIAVYNDGQGTKYLYTGAYGSHHYLVRTDINDINNPSSTEKDIEASAIAVAVDDDTGLVYVTASDNEIKVFDGLNFPSDPCDTNNDPNINGPAGICVPTGDVSYKPGLLTLSKIDDVNDGNSVLPGDYITYTIIYGPNGYNHNNVRIIDYLPYEVTYEYVEWATMSVDVNYNYEDHTYTWVIGPLNANDPDGSVTLTVKVNQLAEPLGKITNVCKIESDIAYNIVTEQTDVNSWNPGIIYVDRWATGSNTGMSWYHAYTNLQNALERARQGCGSEIWVAAGVYKPTTILEDWYATFELADGVPIYGGFAGSETSRNQRNWMINETILDGSIGIYGVFYVVSANDVSQTAIVDGFTIKKGLKAAIYSNNGSLTIEHNKIKENGCGIHCENSNDLTVTNCIFSKNRTQTDGGGICCKDSNSLTVTNCTITDNEAGNYGGGVYDYNSLSSAITNCTFSGNSAGYGGAVFNNSSAPNITNCIFISNTTNYGGGMYNYNESMPTIVNCIFSGNYAGQSGGGICNAYESSPTLINCTFSENFAAGSGQYGGRGGGIYNYQASSPNVTNCIFWDNKANVSGHEIYNYDDDSVPNVTYSDVQDGWPGGEGNIDEDPCFMEVNTPNGSWTENASYDNSTFQSTLTDEYASWSVNELAAKFINSDTSQQYPQQYLQFLIVSNDTNTITVWSDVTSIAHINDTYEIFDYHLGSNSPCIDAGDPNFDPDPNETDIDGEPRIVNDRVDIGADEFDDRDADFSNDGIVNFIDYAMFANTWQTESSDFSLDDDNDVDMNDLALFVEDWLWIAGWAQTEGLMMGQGMSQGFRLMEGLYLSAPAKQQPTQIKPLDIEEIIKLLDEIWLDEEVRKVIDEDEWLKFMESLLKEGL